nr:uncharacterized protein LOC127321492 [Lolium perenne]
MEPPRQGRLPRSRTRTGAARNLRRHQGLPPETLSVFADLALHRVNKSSLPQPVRLQQHPPAFASSRIGSRSGVVRYDKFSGCPSTSFNRYEDMFDEDDVSKVTLPACIGWGSLRIMTLTNVKNSMDVQIRLRMDCIISAKGRS